MEGWRPRDPCLAQALKSVRSQEVDLGAGRSRLGLGPRGLLIGLGRATDATYGPNVVTLHYSHAPVRPNAGTPIYSRRSLSPALAGMASLHDITKRA